jgi:hypothetical protein
LQSELPSHGLAGCWWRFDRYEVVEWRIRPAPGAHLESYDPGSPGEWAAGEPPYLELGRLGQRISDWHQAQVKGSLDRVHREVEPPRDPAPDEIIAYIDTLQLAMAGHYPQAPTAPPELCRAITDFCVRHGLLGIFAQETLAVSLGDSPEVLLDVLEGLPEDHLLSSYQRYERAGGGWRTFSLRTRRPVAKGSCPDLTRRDWLELMRSSGWPLDESHLQAGKVLRRALPARRDLPPALDLVDLEKARNAAFGGAPSRAFPVPQSKEFWRAYGEDLVSFSAYAVGISEALLGLKAEAGKERAQHLAFLNQLLEPVTLEVFEDEGRLRSRYASPSLIGSLAAMAYFDIAGGLRFGQCERCGGLFASRRGDRRFCSTACQRAEKKHRRYHSDAAYREHHLSSARERAAARRAAAAGASDR